MLATDIAETSLTVDGVRVVVDSGLARAPRFDVGTGMTRLTTVSISRDSADQRAGRAGRVEPGVAYRLWSRMEHGTRPAHRAAEITQVDLAGLMLELAAWGTPAGELSFVDQPPAEGPAPGRRAARRARRASTAPGRSPPLGRRMVGLPVHPRLARMIVGRPDTLSCVVAAVVDERDVARARHAIGPRPTSRCASRLVVRARRRRPGRPAGRRRGSASGRPTSPGGPGSASTSTPSTPTTPARRCSSASPTGWPRRRRPGQFQLRNGTGAWVADDDPLATAPFVVAADLDGKRSGARIRLGAAVDEPVIAALLDGVVEDRRLEWDADADDLVERVERRLDALRLGEERRRPAPGEDTTAALVARVRATKLAVLPWTAGDRAAAGAGGVPARTSSATPGRTCPTGRCWPRSTTG